MRRAFLILASVLFVSFQTFAQNETEDTTKRSYGLSYHSQTLLLNGRWDAFSPQKTKFELGVEKSIYKFIGLGTSFSYQTVTYLNTSQIFANTVDIYFHYLRTKKWDVYSSIGLNLSYGFYNPVAGSGDHQNFGVHKSLMLRTGARYYVKPNLAVNAEGTYDRYSGLGLKLGGTFRIR